MTLYWQRRWRTSRKVPNTADINAIEVGELLHAYDWARFTTFDGNKIQPLCGLGQHPWHWAVMAPDGSTPPREMCCGECWRKAGL